MCKIINKKRASKLPLLYIIYLDDDKYNFCSRPFSKKLDKSNSPLIYDFIDDFEVSQKYILKPVYKLSIGPVVCWTNIKDTAELIIDNFNK